MYNITSIHIHKQYSFYSYIMDDQVMTMIEKIQDKYYNNNKKNSFFKKSQKYECADLVTNTVGIDTMLEETIFVFNNNKIFIDYAVFKTFANPNNYHDISLFLARIINDCIHKHKQIEIHINLDTLSISAVERHRSIILNFAEHGQKNQYDKYLTKLELYNTPSFITTTTSILNSFISSNVKQLVNFYKKDESEMLLKTIFS